MENYYKSNWSLELKAVKKSLRYSKSLRCFFCITLFIFLAYIYGLYYIYKLTKNFKIVEILILYFLFPFLIAIFLRVRPKIYSVTDKGVIIDGNTHVWDNFQGYFVDNDVLYLKPYIGMLITLPKDFELIVSKYLRKIRC